MPRVTKSPLYSIGVLFHLVKSYHHPRFIPLLSFYPENYVKRECANLDHIISCMSARDNIAFIGPKGAGKTCTLREAYHKAKAASKPAYYIDAVCFDGRGMFERDDWIFVDNAQVMRDHKCFMCMLRSFSNHLFSI